MTDDIQVRPGTAYTITPLMAVTYAEIVKEFGTRLLVVHRTLVDKNGTARLDLMHDYVLGRMELLEDAEPDLSLVEYAFATEEFPPCRMLVRYLEGMNRAGDEEVPSPAAPGTHRTPTDGADGEKGTNVPDDADPAPEAR